MSYQTEKALTVQVIKVSALKKTTIKLHLTLLSVPGLSHPLYSLSATHTDHSYAATSFFCSKTALVHTVIDSHVMVSTALLVVFLTVATMGKTRALKTAVINPLPCCWNVFSNFDMRIELLLLQSFNFESQVV